MKKLLILSFIAGFWATGCLDSEHKYYTIVDGQMIECDGTDCDGDFVREYKGYSNGSSCSYNSDCRSMICVNNICRSDSESTIVPGDDDTSSETSNYGEGVSKNWNGNGVIPSGTACKLDRDCESGLCYKGVCSENCEMVGCKHSNHVCRYGKCIPTSTNGGECNSKNYKNKCRIGDSCCNGFCRSTACEAGIIYNYGSVTCASNYRYIKDYDVYICGCDSDNQCGAEMFCSDNDTEYSRHQSFICVMKQKFNGPCKADKECRSNACIEGHCANPVDLDEHCNSDNQCKSGTCGEPDNSKYHCKYSSSCYCEPKYDNGIECRQDSNCKSGYCGVRSHLCEDDT